MNEVTRTYFKNLAGQETGQTAADMRAILVTPPDLAAAARFECRASYNANFRTTCVATRLMAATPIMRWRRPAGQCDCRIFPGHSPERSGSN